MRTLPGGFIEPCPPTKADTLLWLHEIKHDGFRIIARKHGVEALARLRSRSCIIDGEAVSCDAGMPSFERIRYPRHDASVFLTPST